MTVRLNNSLPAALLLLLSWITPATADSTLDSVNHAIVAGNYDSALTLIEQALGDHNDDPLLRLKRAQVYSYTDRHNLALHELDKLRLEYPADVDYALARAQVLGRMQRDEEALNELRIATKLAPSYEEVWKLRFDLLSRQVYADAQSERERLRDEAARRFPESSWWQKPTDPAATLWTVLVSASHEDLNKGLPNWDHQFIELTREAEGEIRLGFRVNRDVRNDSADMTLGINAEQEWSSGWFGGVDTGFSNDADFQPDIAFSGHAGRTLRDGWVADLRYRRREYSSASVDSVIGTVEKYLGDFRFAYSPGLSRLDGSSTFLNHVVTVNWFYDEDASLAITISTGEEAESIGIGQVLKTDVSGIVLSGRQPLNHRFGLQWWLGSHEQGDFYRRRFFGLAVSYRI